MLFSLPQISNCVWITSLGSSIGDRGALTHSLTYPSDMRASRHDTPYMIQLLVRFPNTCCPLSLRNAEQPVAARTSTGPDTPRPYQLMAAPCPRGAAALHAHGHALSLQAHVGYCGNLRVSFREKEACSSGSGHLSSSVSRGPRTRGRGQLGKERI